MIKGQIGSRAVSDEVTEELVGRTRGKAGEDIEEVVSKYLATGVLPEPAKHPTNACDPYTGNWAERLIPPNSIVQRLESLGLSGIELAPGYWSIDSANPLKALAQRSVNQSFRLLGSRGLRFAPYYVVRGSAGFAGSL